MMKRERLVAVVSSIALLAGLFLSQAAIAIPPNPDYTGCVSTPLPTAPTGPSVKKTWNLSQASLDMGKLTVEVWRTPCSDTDSAVLLRISAEKSTVDGITFPIYACGSNFSVVQDSIQYMSARFVQGPGGSEYCFGYLVPQTFLLEQSFGFSNFDDDASFSLYYIMPGSDGRSLDVPAYDPSSIPVKLDGTIKTPDGSDICAMVLASGQFMFSCNPPGVLSLPNLPREPDGTVKRQIYADGFFPKVDTLTGSTDEAVVMTRSGTCPNYNASYDPGFVPGSAGKRIDIAGKVLLQNGQTPVCAMVLANGQYMFTCDGTGNYALSIPLDSNGQYKLQVYADGFAPITQKFDEFKTTNIVRMARSVECQ